MANGTRTFEYSVRDRKGKLVNGKLEAPTEAALVQKLRSMGYAPVTVREAGTGMNRDIKLPGSDKVPLKDLAVMSRQFATMINSGLTLLRALSILAEQTDNAALAKVLGEVRTAVEGGQSLSSALARHPKVFPPLMVNMCRAGEVGGFLDQVLLQLAEGFEAEVKLQAKIKSAMTYPVVVFVIAVLAVIGMLLFIVPTFDSMFSSLGAELPGPTQLLVDMSQGLKRYGVFMLAAVVAVTGVWQRVKHRPRVREVVDPLLLKMPVFGMLTQKVALSRFTRNFGTMLHAGVPILQSLEIVGDASGNVVLRRAAKAIEESVRRGDSLSAPLSQHPVFPPMVVQMMAVGEDTGALDLMLHKISEFYDQEVEATTEALTSLIEPLMIAFLGGVVGAMVIALYLPIFSLSDAVGG